MRWLRGQRGEDDGDARVGHARTATALGRAHIAGVAAAAQLSGLADNLAELLRLGQPRDLAQVTVQVDVALADGDDLGVDDNAARGAGVGARARLLGQQRPDVEVVVVRCAVSRVGSTRAHG